MKFAGYGLYAVGFAVLAYASFRHFIMNHVYAESFIVACAFFAGAIATQIVFAASQHEKSPQ